MKKEQLSLIIAEGEGLFVEFKLKFTSKIDEDLVAFANTKGGRILLGVDDARKVVGEKLTNTIKSSINTIARNCKPRIDVKIASMDGVIIIDVPEGVDKPYSCSSGYFRRLDATTQKMDRDELRMLFSEYDDTSFERKISKTCTLKEISKEKIRSFLDEANIQLRRVDVQQLLESLKLLENGGINNAGVLFFSKKPRDHILQNELQLIAFKGITNNYIYDREYVHDDLLTQFNKAIAFLKRNLNIRAEIRGVNRYDILEIPEEVLREAVVNAIIHRDYSVQGASLTIHVYDDRVEISNPGGFLKNFSEKYFGKKSVRRNELIADMFARMRKVERAGTGFIRMNEAMQYAGLKAPVFEVDNFFTITLYRSKEYSLKSGREVTEKVTEGVTEKVTENQAKILDMLKRNNTMTVVELSDSLSISRKSILENISKLKSKKLLRRIGPAKGGRWKILK